ncbi:spore germination cell wall hydrolase CwlJ-like protein [Halomonas campaniensis]|uniref:Spore germination cell wall hydrolase CwlJ-like protein n=1 Tax=Halomonas campaniensis TaxID=213554 RepID=A0A7W5K545_9GAMM|nr:cell wall hydrolase [Halomonas campaniensis]MBB3332081.1 spore germination cell wall hydrolase CwlJ-like protein [Halomonas campaniensis]
MHPWVTAALLALLLVSVRSLADQEERAEAAAAKAEVLERVVAPDATATPPDEPITEQEVQAVDPAGTDPLEEPITCLARAIYWEAKGVPGRDMEAVANVVMNRLAHEGFPNTVCNVVTEGSEQPPCQFSWWCDGRPDEVVEPDAYEIAREVARQALNLELADHTGGALYFHDRTVTPHWSAVYPLTAETEQFLFYRPEGG